jgi:branched-subunit amino acid aminotransferase/4-amino-4-deoxychorismate lyase
MRLSLDGEYPDVEALAHRVTVNYGHFTSMQVRDQAVRGLDLHLDRLRAASRELHGAELDPRRVRSYLKAALAEMKDASARIDVFLDATNLSEHIMVSISDPEPTPAKSLTLRSVAYQRPVPHIKHTGGFAQLFHQKEARKEGFDDALLVGNNGVLSETAIANIGFIRRGEIIWPAADALCGITWQLLNRLVRAQEISTSFRPIHLHEVPGFDAAFTTNSHGITPVRRIDEVGISLENEMLQRISSLYEAEPFQPI